MRLPSLAGNLRLKAALARMEGEDFAAAILIEGPEGSGKRTAAMDIAAALLCTGSDRPCGRCGACIRVKAGSHPDLEWFNPKQLDCKVDDVRQLRARSFIRPGESGHKIFILCAADKMNLQAQNAMLKVLEEPQSSVFILLTEARESLLPTVRSRCISFRMEPFRQDELIRELHLRFPWENDGRLERAAAESGGYLGPALSFLSGEESEAQTLAHRFLEAFQKTELDVYRSCAQAGKLSREDYRAFCAFACAGVHRLAVCNPDRAFVRLYEYLETEQDMTDRNASVSALSGALCAVCGRILEEKEGGNA